MQWKGREVESKTFLRRFYGNNGPTVRVRCEMCKIVINLLLSTVYSTRKWLLRSLPIECAHAVDAWISGFDGQTYVNGRIVQSLQLTIQRAHTWIFCIMAMYWTWTSLVPFPPCRLRQNSWLRGSIRVTTMFCFALFVDTLVNLRIQQP